MININSIRLPGIPEVRTKQQFDMALNMPCFSTATFTKIDDNKFRLTINSETIILDTGEAANILLSFLTDRQYQF